MKTLDVIRKELTTEQYAGFIQGLAILHRMRTLIPSGDFVARASGQSNVPRYDAEEHR